MNRHTLVILAAVAMALIQSRAIFAAGDAPAGFQCDGSLLSESFDGGTLPKGWELPAGGNRREVSFKDGMCILQAGKGDNFIALPALAINFDEVVVVEMSFSIPAPTSGGFSLVTLSREGGEFKVLLSAGEKGQYLVMTRSRPLGLVEPGKTYTVALRCHPDGSYEATLTGETIKQPVVQKVAGPDGGLKANLMLGNNVGSADGGVSVDQVKVGKPIQQ
jgi:hypothetical protein